MTILENKATLLSPSLSPRRVSPLYLVDDIESARRRYAALGFQLVETGDAGCIEMFAGSTSVILVTPEHAARTMPQAAIESLRLGPALYVWVDSIEMVQATLADPVIGETVTDFGTWELFTESRVGLVIFAEKLDYKQQCVDRAA